jgi:hypothetical protein
LDYFNWEYVASYGDFSRYLSGNLSNITGENQKSKKKSPIIRENIIYRDLSRVENSIAGDSLNSVREQYYSLYFNLDKSYSKFTYDQFIQSSIYLLSRDIFKLQKSAAIQLEKLLQEDQNLIE